MNKLWNPFISAILSQGPVLAWLHAVEAYKKCGQQLPVNLKVWLQLPYIDRYMLIGTLFCVCYFSGFRLVLNWLSWSVHLWALVVNQTASQQACKYKKTPSYLLNLCFYWTFWLRRKHCCWCVRADGVWRYGREWQRRSWWSAFEVENWRLDAGIK